MAREKEGPRKDEKVGEKVKSRNISDEERQAIFSRGQFKTIVEKDAYYDEHDVTVIALERVGTKYIWGLVCHLNDQGNLEPNYWVGSFEKDRCQVYDGQRWDLVNMNSKYRIEKRERQTRRQDAERQAWYECESRARQECAEIMAKWDSENPSPKDPLTTA